MIISLLKYCLSSSYRKHRWVAKNLSVYRLKPRWLFIRRIRRVINKPMVFNKIVGAKFGLKDGTIIIPQFKEITALELEDDIPLT